MWADFVPLILGGKPKRPGPTYPQTVQRSIAQTDEAIVDAAVEGHLFCNKKKDMAFRNPMNLLQDMLEGK